MALFGGRGPNAPTALYEVAAELGWQPVPVPGHVSLQPPTFARADVEGLTAGARSQAWMVQAPDGTTASHLDVFHDEYDESVYDMVRRAAPATRAGLPHVELTCGGKPYQNHRLGGRGGFTAEVLDGRLAVFTLTVAARRGTDRWRALVAAGLLVGRILDDVCRSA